MSNLDNEINNLFFPILAKESKAENKTLKMLEVREYQSNIPIFRDNKSFASIQQLTQLAQKRAQRHRDSNRIGYSKTKKKLCFCCGQDSKKVFPEENNSEQRNWNFNFKDISIAGSGFGLFYQSIKFFIVLLFLHFAITDIYRIVLIFKNEQEVQSMMEYLVLKQGGEIIPAYLEIIIVMLMIVMFIMFRVRMYKLDQAADIQHTSEVDFSVRIENIPKVMKVTNQKHQYDEEIKIGLQKIIQKRLTEIRNMGMSEQKKLSQIQQFYCIESKFDAKIVNVICCYNISEFQVYNQHIANIRKQAEQKSLQLLDLQQNGTQTQKKQVQEKLEDILFKLKIAIHGKYQKLLEFQRSSGYKFNLSYFVGQAFVICNSQWTKELLIQIGKQNKLNFKQNVLIAREADQPKDIRWENLHFSNKQILFRKLASWLLTIIFLSIALLILFFVYKYQDYLYENNIQGFLGMILSYAVSGFISGLNIGLGTDSVIRFFDSIFSRTIEKQMYV